MSKQNGEFNGEQKQQQVFQNDLFYPFYHFGPCPYFPCFPAESFKQLEQLLKLGVEKQKELLQNAKKDEKQLEKQNEKKEKENSIKIESSDLFGLEEDADNKDDKNEEKELSCQCSKSACLKEYCHCFKKGAACGEKCGCVSCKNDQDELNEKRNPLRRKRVTCKCAKSHCQKKYCECYTAQKKCEESCRCVGCEN